MSDFDMDAALPALDLSRVPSNFVTMMFQIMSLSERLKCALVCKAWAQEAAAATRSIIFRDSVQDVSCLQRWLEKHGGQVEVLQLHECRDPDMLTALPCPQLQDLLLSGHISLDRRVWSDIAAAPKLTSVSLEWVQTASLQADVVSALTALPDLEQLTWRRVKCGWQTVLTDSMLLHKLTKLEALVLVAAAEALEHLCLLTRLQDLSLCVTDGPWVAAGCPGLQELRGLTWIDLENGFDDIPASVSQLTALQQLEAQRATPTALNKLSALTGLTHVGVQQLSPGSPPLQLPGLQHLTVCTGGGTLPMSFLANCTQLRCWGNLTFASAAPAAWWPAACCRTCSCVSVVSDGAADPVPWQRVFPGPGQLPHLTSLKFSNVKPVLQHADMECVVACCSSLQVLQLEDLPGSITSAVTRLSGLTSLMLWKSSDQQCSSLAQLTGLTELRVKDGSEVFAAGLQQLAALEQLTSLRLDHLGWSSNVLREHMSDRLPGPLTNECVLINKAPAGQPPDVSARLRRACDMAAAADS